jgi:hypothetical protein
MSPPQFISRRSIQAFYEGLNDTNKSLADSAGGGVLMEKYSEEAIELFETLSENSQQFSSRGRHVSNGKGVYEVRTNSGVQTQMATMERKLDMLVKAMTTQNISQIQQVQQVEVCAICSHSNYTTETCPMSVFQSKSMLIMWDRTTFLPRTTPTPTLTIHNGEITQIFLEVAIKMSKIHRDNRGTSNQELVTRLHHLRSNQALSQRRMILKVLYSNS